MKTGYVKAQEKQMQLDASEYLKRVEANNSLFPKGIYKVVETNKETHEVFLSNKYRSFSLTFTDDELFNSIKIGQKITFTQ